jgi:hypothetical protein
VSPIKAWPDVELIPVDEELLPPVLLPHPCRIKNKDKNRIKLIPFRGQENIPFMLIPPHGYSYLFFYVFQLMIFECIMMLRKLSFGNLFNAA